MGCSLFSNSHFQMGVTVMGFAKNFGQYFVAMAKPEITATPKKIKSCSSKDL